MDWETYERVMKPLRDQARSQEELQSQKSDEQKEKTEAPYTDLFKKLIGS